MEFPTTSGIDMLAMEPIAEAPLSLMEESTNTTTRLLEMMTVEAGSSAEDCDDDDDSGILDQAAMLSLDDTSSPNQVFRKHHGKPQNPTPGAPSKTTASRKNLNIQPAAPSTITSNKKSHNDNSSKSNHDFMMHHKNHRNSNNHNIYPASHILQHQKSTMNKRTNQSFPPVPTLKTPLSKPRISSSQNYHRTTGNVTGICPLPSPPPHDSTVAVVSPLTTTSTTSPVLKDDSDTNLLPSPSSPPSVGLTSGHSITDSAGMETSPTSVMTPVGMTSIDDMSTIAPNGTSVHVVNDDDGDDDVGIIHISSSNAKHHHHPSSPKSNNSAMVDEYFEQRQKRHRRRHHLDEKESDEENVVKEDLLKRLSQDPSGVDGAVLTTLITTATSGSTSRSSSGHHSTQLVHHHHHQYEGPGNHYDMDDDANEGLISKRLQAIECKKVALHQKRISLEQRLYDFVDSEKRMRLMISTSPMSAASFMDTSLMLGSDLSHGNRSINNNLNTSLLHLPMPMSPQLRHHQQQLSPSFQNGDEMVQDHPWTDPRSKTIAYRYSGPLNTLKQPHGWGTMHFLDGQVYQGQIYAGYRWGMGTVIFCCCWRWIDCYVHDICSVSLACTHIIPFVR